ncbi:MAG: DUF3179 domain-containing protein [Caldilineae bacterium]|nr:MAG: DUF3179 domain-containing protein [Caldilineae bacterium]
MHDRRIDGKPEVFGNAGGLFMTAMTWYDHSTRSIWSQPWGRAIRGPRTGTELRLLPSQITTWSRWEAEHPETLVMVNGIGGLRMSVAEFRENFVIGLKLEDRAKAYPYPVVKELGVVNDHLGEFPVVVWADEHEYRAYLRLAGDLTLTFEREGEKLRDVETGSVWDAARGIALEGPLAGTLLQQVPNLTAYDWAWFDFYPDSAFFEP